MVLSMSVRYLTRITSSATVQNGTLYIDLLNMFDVTNG